MAKLKAELDLALIKKDFKDRYGKYYQCDPSVSEDRVLDFIILTYHPESELVRSIHNIIRRKYEAAKIADFPPKQDNKFKKHYEAIVLGNSTLVNKMIILFLRMINNPDYSLLQVYIKSYYNSLEALESVEHTGTDDAREQKARAEAREKLTKVIQTTRENIKDCERSLMQGDDTKDVLEALYENIDEEILAITPEHIADKIQNNEDPIGHHNPYR